MALDLSRRNFICGIGAMVAAPAIVRAASLMPVKALDLDPTFQDLQLAFDDVSWRYDPLELTAMVRRAFIPRLYVQLYESAPPLTEYLVGGAHG